MTINFSYEGLNPEETAVFCDMTSYISTDILGVDKKKDHVELKINDGAEKIVEGKLEELKEMICSSEMKMKDRVKTKILEDHTSNTPINTAPVNYQDRKSVV